MSTSRSQPPPRDAIGSGVGGAKRAPGTVDPAGVVQSGPEDVPVSRKADIGPALGSGASPEIDLAALKDVVRRLPDQHPIRQLIEDEPDSLPLSDLAIKADLWVRLLLREQGRRQENSNGATGRADHGKRRGGKPMGRRGGGKTQAQFDARSRSLNRRYVVGQVALANETAQRTLGAAAYKAVKDNRRSQLAESSVRARPKASSPSASQDNPTSG